MYTQLEKAIVGMSAMLMPEGYDVTAKDDADINSFKAICDYYSKTGRVIVSSANSEHTIYSHPEINVAFRAWHDYIHITQGLKFTRKGEAKVCCVQQAQAANYLSENGASPEEIDFVVRCLHIEVVEQVEHYFETGQFVGDQVAFMAQHLGA